MNYEENNEEGVSAALLKKRDEFRPFVKVHSNADNTQLTEENNNKKPQANKENEKSKNDHPGCGGFFKTLSSCWKRTPEDQPRTMTFEQNPRVTPHNHRKNTVVNTKYNVITFVPLVLYNQFKYFSNLFFLLTALSQFYPPLQVGYLFAYLGPLLLVLGLTMLKELYDDLNRYRKDRKENSTEYNLMTPDGFVSIASGNLRVGNIIEIQENQRIPADCILLHSSEHSGTIYLKTDQLDGETDWKVRKAIRFTQEYYTKNNTLLDIPGASITANPPIVNIYQFEGVFEKGTDAGDNFEVKEPLGLENTMWGSTTLTAGKVLAMVIYVGPEMRISMNSRTPRSKVGKLDLEINFLTKLLFVIMMALSVTIVALDKFAGKWYITVFRFMLLFSSIIPISLRVNLDIAKLVYSWMIGRDEKIKGAVVRNTVIPEELGRVEFLLTDKTGTLTQNDMIFKKLSFEFGTYGLEDMEDLRDALHKQCEKYNGPLADYDEKFKNQGNSQGISKKVFRREKECLVRDVVTGMCVCHNVRPVEENGEKSFQGSSPDELALVNIAESLNFTLNSREDSKINLTNAAKKEEEYEILLIFPFTSATKRMGIILKHSESNRFIFFLKGADTVMKTKVIEKHRSFLLEECDTLAREGLRTLVFAQKYLTQSEYEEWKKGYDEAAQSLEDREAKTQEVIEQLEQEMEFLGIIGVEDKLQDKVRETLEMLRTAGIKVWMLTGDKVETATCIAISAGMKSNLQTTYTMKDLSDPFEISYHLDQFQNKPNCILIIDGSTLTHTLEHLKETFFAVATEAPAVLCCRCAPTQKAQICEGIKQTVNLRTCCIGDGGNDVGMIQAADVGIGIEGKEGKQAALAADYSIVEFKHLNNMLLWHGRLAYKRSAMLTHFIIHRGLTIAVIQMYFSLIFYNISIPIYGGPLLIGYTTVYTVLPVFALIFDEDIDLESALSYPPLYKNLQKGRALNSKTLFCWVFISIYQGFVIMVCALYFFEKSFLQIVTITFSVLIISEYLNIITEVHKMTKILKISVVLSLFVYFLSAIIFGRYISLEIIGWGFGLKVIILTAISWVPVLILRLLKDAIDPSDFKKIMKNARSTKNVIEPFSAK